MANYVPIFAPIRPSNLRQPSGPSSPASPLTPPATRPWLHDLAPSRSPSPKSQSSDSDGSSPHSAPSPPLPWVWSCHICHSNYPLGVTRRCLHDGHYLCAGNATHSKRTRRVKKNKPCLSEFDYEGWSRWGRWRRNNTQDQKHVIYRGKDCWNHCDFPSHCMHQNVRVIETPNLDSMLSRQADPAATFDRFIEPFTTEPDPPEPDLPALKRTSSTLARLLKAAEKRTSQIATMLSPIQEENSRSEPPSKISAPKIQAPDFASFKARMDKLHDASKLKDEEQPSTLVKFSSNNGDEDTPYPSDVESNNEENHPPQPSKPTHKPQYPPSSAFTAKTMLLHQPFDLELPQRQSKTRDEDSAAPRRNAWDWTAGDLGTVILSPSAMYESFEEILQRLKE